MHASETSRPYEGVGWRRDVEALLNISDVLMLTSLWEGLPQVFSQAMSLGKPIIATHVDGVPEAVEHGVNGLLHEPKDVLGLARSLLAILNNDDLRLRMGKASRSR